MAKKLCPNPTCNSGDCVDNDDNYCYKCGTVLILSDELTCSCGYELCSSDYYCPKCGKKTDKE